MFGPDIQAAIRRDAEARYPEEACGIVTSAGYEAQPNLAAEPEMNFEMPLEVARRIAAGDVLAVAHSHNERCLDHPSTEDQRQCLEMALPWGLVLVRDGRAGEPFWWGDGVPTPPIMPRDYRPGPSGTDGRGDCFALARDWYAAERGLHLPDVPRTVDWEDDMPDAFMAGWVAAGFARVPEEAILPGDGLLFSIQTLRRIPNHCGIYLGDGLFLHHLRNRLVQREGLGFWRRSLVAVLRPPAC